MEHMGLISTVFSDNEAFLYSDDKLVYYASVLSINGARSTKNRLRSLAGKYITYQVVQKHQGVSDIAIRINATPKLKRIKKALRTLFH
jgi:hypothetical protein